MKRLLLGQVSGYTRHQGRPPTRLTMYDPRSAASRSRSLAQTISRSLVFVDVESPLREHEV